MTTDSRSAFPVSTIVAFCFLPALVLGPIFFGAVHVFWASVVEVLVCIGFLAVLLRVTVAGRRLIRDALDAAILLCWVYVTARYVTSTHEYQSRLEWLSVSAAFWVYFSIRSLRGVPWLAPGLLVFLILAACGISAYALYQKFSGSLEVLWLTSSYPGRVSGTYYCPNHFAGFLEFFIPFLLAMVLFLRVSVAWRLVLCYALLSMAAAHFYAYSRGGLLASAAGVSVVFFLGWRNKPAALMVLFVVGVLGSFVFAYVLRSTDILEYHRYSSAIHGEWSRKEMWKSALSLWKDHPWFGLGPMQFDWWHASVRGNIPARAVYVHNDYLHLLVDYGLAGALFFAGFLALALRKLAAGCRQYELLRTTYHQPHVVLRWDEGFQRAAFIGCAGALTALFLHSVVDFNMHIPANAILFAFFMAFGHNLCERQGEQLDPIPRVRQVQRLVAACLIGVVIWQLWAIRQTAEADRFVRAAESHRKKFEWTKAAEAYREAVKIDPRNSDAWARYARLCYERSILDAGKKKAYQREFLTISEKALELNALNKLLRIRRGEVLDLMGRYADAQREYEDAVHFDPLNGYYWNKFARHYAKWGRKADAQKLFKRAAGLPGGKSQADINLRLLGPIKESDAS